MPRPQAGMTTLEMLIALLMLVVFTGVVAMVMEFSLRFLRASEAGERNAFEVSNGVLIDHAEIQLGMNLLVEMLSQPGISKDHLYGTLSGQQRIVFDPAKHDPRAACVAADPVGQWGLPMQKVSFPPGYRLCLWKTTSIEPSFTALLAGAKPGIYLLQALPEKLDAATLPTRRLFCRPRPFC
ncbi:hypothetical protein OAE35_03080 [Synechococcus sp. AH-551-E02]|nr:hypothetical protein [Synechococcus sp. AH-551-E02]MDB4653864.1 hypothetical protein [Synechococcus sp. AH-551-E02]